MKSALCFLVAAKRSEQAGLERLALTGELVKRIGRLVHALQRERGLSNLYLGSKASRWGDAREEQVCACEALQAEVLSSFNQLDTDAALSGHRARLFGRIAYALQGLEALPLLRERVRSQAWTAVQATTAYIRLINALLAVVFEAADSTWDPGISRHLVAFFNFLQGKEFAGQERAVGAALFAAGRADTDSQQRLLHLIESQERCMQVFIDFASPPLGECWRGIQRAEHLVSWSGSAECCAQPRPVQLSLGLTSRHFEPLQIGLALDVVKNTGFDAQDILQRAGTTAVDGLKAKTLGYQARLSVGHAQLQEAGDWQAFMAWRHFERDAWVDAFTDTAWHAGGTNYRGFSLGGQYAFDKRSTLGLRFTSTRNLDDGVRFLAIPDDPSSVSGEPSSAPLKIDTVQLDATIRF